MQKINFVKPSEVEPPTAGLSGERGVMPQIAGFYERPQRRTEQQVSLT